MAVATQTTPGAPDDTSGWLDSATAAFQSQTLPIIQQQMQLLGLGQSPMVAQIGSAALGSQLTPLLTADMQRKLQQQSIDNERTRIANEYALGTGQLGVAQSGQALAERLGLGRLTLDQAAQVLQEKLGMGQLSLGEAQQALQEKLGMGQLEVAKSAQDLQRELGTGQLALSRELGTGQLALGRELGLGQLGLGEGQLALGQQSLAAQTEAARAQQQLAAYGLSGNLMLGLGNPLTAAQSGQQQQQMMGLQGYSQAGTAQQQAAQQAFNNAAMELLRLQGLSEAGSTGIFGGSVIPPSISSGSQSNTQQASSK